MHELVKPETLTKWLRKEAEKNKVRRSEVSAGAHFVARARKMRQSADLIEKQAERIERLESLLRENISTMEEQCRRFRRLGKSHAELDTVIEYGRQALSPTEDE